MSWIFFREYYTFYVIMMWVDLVGFGPSHLSKSVSWARRTGPLFGLLWRNTGMARSPLRFWAGEWDTWPISLSLSIFKICFYLILVTKCVFFVFEKFE